MESPNIFCKGFPRHQYLVRSRKYSYQISQQEWGKKGLQVRVFVRTIIMIICRVLFDYKPMNYYIRLISQGRNKEVEKFLNELQG